MKSQPPIPSTRIANDPVQEQDDEDELSTSPHAIQQQTDLLFELSKQKLQNLHKMQIQEKDQYPQPQQDQYQKYETIQKQPPPNELYQNQIKDPQYREQENKKTVPRGREPKSRSPEHEGIHYHQDQRSLSPIPLSQYATSNYSYPPNYEMAFRNPPIHYYQHPCKVKPSTPPPSRIYKDQGTQCFAHARTPEQYELRKKPPIFEEDKRKYSTVSASSCPPNLKQLNQKEKTYFSNYPEKQIPKEFQDRFGHNGTQFQNFPEAPIKTDQQRQIISTQRKLDKPKYYDPKTVKPDLSQFSELIKSGPINLINYKTAFLSNSGILYETQDFKIAQKVTTSSFLSIVLFYCNKNVLKMELSIEFPNLSSNKYIYIFIGPETLQLNPNVREFSLAGNETRKQEIIIKQYSIENPQILLKIDYRISIKVPLPTTINKFMEFHPIDKLNFKSLWQSLRTSIQQTTPISLNPKLISSNQDFEKFFDFLIDLTTNNSIQKHCIKKGGMFILNGNFECLLKIKIFEDRSACFQVIGINDHPMENVAILNCLSFLFS